MKKTMGSSQQDREGKTQPNNEPRKARPEKIQDRDRSEGPPPHLGSASWIFPVNCVIESIGGFFTFESAIMIGQKRVRVTTEVLRGVANSRAKAPSLLQISSQIRKEAIPIYYRARILFLYTGEILNHQRLLSQGYLHSCA